MNEPNDNSNQEGAEGGAEEAAAAAADPVKNVKAEFDRKMSNVQDQLRTQTELLQKTLDQLAASRLNPPAPEPSYDPIVDPEKYTDAVVKKAVREAVGEVEQRSALSQRTQSEIIRIQNMYPEFSQQNSDAARLVMQKYQQLPESKKGTPDATKMIMFEAAAELGLTPASNRKKVEQEEDDFSMSGSAPPNTGSRRRESTSKVDPKTIALAELLGLNPNDPATKKSLEERAKRDKWTNWRS